MTQRRLPWTPILALVLAAGLAACGGGEQSSDAPGAEAGGSQARAQASAAGADEDPEALADQGEQLFQRKGCNACHTFGKGRLVGPDLVGVTDRRERSWIESMILHPDSMVRTDSIAKQLLAEYYTPMQNMGVTPQEADALYHYLRRQTENAAGGAR